MLAALPTLTLAAVILWCWRRDRFAGAERARAALPAFFGLDLAYHIAQSMGWSASQRAIYAGWPALTAFLLGGPCAIVWLSFAVAAALVPLPRWAYYLPRFALIPLMPAQDWDEPDARAGLVIAAGQIAGVLIGTWPDRGAQTLVSCTVWLAAGLAITSRKGA